MMDSSLRSLDHGRYKDLKAHSEPCQTIKIERFEKIVNGFSR